MNENIKPEQVKAILAHFNGKPVNNNILAEYCNLNKFSLITLSQYEDCLFQQEHDDRVSKMLPALFAEISQYRDVPTFGSEEEIKAIREANNDIVWKIAKLFEDYGVTHKDYKTITRGLGNLLKNIMDNVETSIENMTDVVLKTVTKETLNDNGLTIKSMAEWYRTRAKKLGEKIDYK